MADEEPVNPQIEVEESCKPQCVKAWLEYQVRLSPAAGQQQAVSSQACQGAGLLARLSPTSNG
jgi:hypothetical protein